MVSAWATSNSLRSASSTSCWGSPLRSATSTWIVVRDAEQPPQHRLLLDELAVVAGVAGRGHGRRQLVHVGLAARLLQLAALLQLGADGERVDRLVLVVEREDRLKIARCESR